MQPLTFDLLERFEALLRSVGADIAHDLRPGLTDAQIDALTLPLGLRLPAEPRTWWKWHDGAPDTGLFLFDLSPLRDTVEFYSMNTRVAQEELRPNPALWRDGWFPLTTGQPFLACDVAVEAEACSPVFQIRWDDPDDHPPVVASVGEAVTQMMEAIDSGRWTWSDDHGWDRDDSIPRPEGHLQL